MAGPLFPDEEALVLGTGPHITVGTGGDFDAGDGFKAVVTISHVHFLARMDGGELFASVPIEAILDALGTIHKVAAN